jgi:FAD/FMN-containing dehydrogenase
MLVDFMRRKGLALKRSRAASAGGGFLLVEMGAWTAEEARQGRSPCPRRAILALRAPVGPHLHAGEAAQRLACARVRARRHGLCPGEPDRFEGWEDAAVPPAQLGAYLRAITALMAEYGYRSPLYGHYGQGCVHTRINFDFRSAEGLRRFREFIERAADLVLSFGGSLSGEHGDGQSRAALLPKMFGPELMEAFREFKASGIPTTA